MKIILNEIQDDLLTIKTVIEKYYSIVPLSTFNEINLSDNYSIQIAIVFVPKKESTITPEIYTASARFKIGQSDTIGRPLFMISSQSYPSDEIMPLLSLIGRGSRDSFKSYCDSLFNNEARKKANKIDPDWELYYSE